MGAVGAKGPFSRDSEGFALELFGSRVVSTWAFMLCVLHAFRGSHKTGAKVLGFAPLGAPTRLNFRLHLEIDGAKPKEFTSIVARSFMAGWQEASRRNLFELSKNG